MSLAYVKSLIKTVVLATGWDLFLTLGVLLFPILGATSQAFSIEIISPRDDLRYLDSEGIPFQGKALNSQNQDLSLQIVWHIVGRLNDRQEFQTGSEFQLNLEPGIYDIEAKILSADGQVLDLVHGAFSVFHKPDIKLSLSKRKVSGQWFWTKYETQVEWRGAKGPVGIFQQVACAGGFTGTKPCHGWLQIGKGDASGNLSLPYHKEDFFRVCEAGILPESDQAEWQCSS